MSTNALPRSDGTFTLEGVLDRTILELFLNHGESSATTIFYPSKPLSFLTFEVECNRAKAIYLVYGGLYNAL
jgi:beta-fructofuranosidase